MTTRRVASGSVAQAQRNISNGLHPSVRRMFETVMARLRRHLAGSNLYLSAPPLELWITVKLHPKKAVLAFRNADDASLVFDIDTYAHDDITVDRRLFRLTPNPNKPNKRHVGLITPTTSASDLNTMISTMIEGMNKFE